jgi:WD40 repeat protein
MHLRTLQGHTDNIWSLDCHPQLPMLVSASADGSIGLWQAEAESSSREPGTMDAKLRVGVSDDASLACCL